MPTDIWLRNLPRRGPNLRPSPGSSQRRSRNMTIIFSLIIARSSLAPTPAMRPSAEDQTMTTVTSIHKAASINPLKSSQPLGAAFAFFGVDNLEEAILNLKNRTKPKLIGVCTTALVETRGEDFSGDLANIKRKRAEELAGTEVVLVQTPDFDGAIEEGWSKAVTALVGLVPSEPQKRIIPDRINILPGWHLTAADSELLRETAEAFGLDPIITPDISGSL